MRIFRNGVLAYDETAGDDFDDGQLSQFSLGISAMDAEVGMGSIAVPGDPAWNAGDRITIYEGGPVGDTDVVFGGIPVTFGGIQVVWTNNGPWGEYLIYTGFVGQHSRIRNPNSPLELTSIYQLMDPNRQLIGRAVIDYYRSEATVGGVPIITAGGQVLAFIEDYLSDLDLDLGYDFGNSTVMQAQTYNSDGMMDIIGTLVLYTGWTVFLTTTQTENKFFFHFHSLTSGALSSISIDDTPGAADNVTVFAPRDPEWLSDPADLGNDIELRNGLQVYAGDNPSSIAIYDVGGLRWQKNLSYSIDNDSATIYINTLLQQATEKVTYRCTIGPLDGSQIVAIAAGSLIASTSVVWGVSAEDLRISRITLSPSQGSTVAPGLWDVALELSIPTRLPAAALGLSGQGGYYGSFTDPFNAIDHYQPVSGGQFVASDIPVGGTYRINYQMVDKYTTALAIPGDTATFTLELWEDVDETIPTVDPDWSISIPTGGEISDTKGQVYVDLTHDFAGTTLVVNVVCSR